MMDSNQLLHYLRGFFELVDEPTPAQIRTIRNEVLRARPVIGEPFPVEVPPRQGYESDCGCGPPKPVLDHSKL